jgi:hypothetical protein
MRITKRLRMNAKRAREHSPAHLQTRDTLSLPNPLPPVGVRVFIRPVSRRRALFAPSLDRDAARAQALHAALGTILCQALYAEVEI